MDVRFRSIVLALLPFMLLGCDCVMTFSGQVRATATGQPLAGVLVKVVDQQLTALTDTSGNFELVDVTGFCYTQHLRLSLDGYKPFEVVFDEADGYHQTQVRTELQDIEYSEPFYPDPNNRRTFITGMSIERFSQHYALLKDTTVYYLDISDPDAEVRENKRLLREAFVR